MKQAWRSLRRTLAPQAQYTNYFEVGQNALEFMLDFGQYHPENSSALCHTRIVTGPVYAKMLAGLLVAAVKRHELEHGAISSVERERNGTGTDRTSQDIAHPRRSTRGRSP